MILSLSLNYTILLLTLIAKRTLHKRVFGGYWLKLWRGEWCRSLEAVDLFLGTFFSATASKDFSFSHSTCCRLIISFWSSTCRLHLCLNSLCRTTSISPSQPINKLLTEHQSVKSLLAKTSCVNNMRVEFMTEMWVRSAEMWQIIKRHITKRHFEIGRCTLQQQIL